MQRLPPDRNVLRLSVAQGGRQTGTEVRSYIRQLGKGTEAAAHGENADGPRNGARQILEALQTNAGAYRLSVGREVEIKIPGGI